jgi:predicted DNA-binding protein
MIMMKKKLTPCNIRLDDHEAAMLQNLADEAGKTKSEIMRESLSHYGSTVKGFETKQN